MWSERRLLFGCLLVGGAASLLLNVFLVGWAIGHGFGGGHRAAGPAGGIGAGGGRPVVQQSHVKLLSPDERRRFSAAMSGYRPAIRAARETVRERRQAVEAALTAPTYDAAAATSAFAALRAADAAVAEALHGGLVGAMAELPQPARAALVRRDEPREGGVREAPAAGTGTAPGR